MVSRDLTRVLKQRYPGESSATAYLDQLRTITQAANLARRQY
jgi:hypothetical protein